MSTRRSQIERPWRSLARVTWLEHRAGFIGLFLVYVGLGLAIVLEEESTRAIFATYVAHGCEINPFHVPCGTIANTFSDSTDPFSALVIALNALPVVVGVFVGAPLLSRELETGTFRFSFTQGVGRRRYLLTTLAMLAVFVAAGAALVGSLLGGWAHLFEVVGNESRWQSGTFATGWPVLAGWSLLALALGTLVGVVVRRVVPAMAVTAAVVGGLVVATFDTLIPKLLSVGTVASNTISPLGLDLGTINQSIRGEGPSGSWLVRSWMTGLNGHELSTTQANALRDQLYAANGKSDPARFLAFHHAQFWVAYLPAGHFWAYQAVGAAILLVLAVAVIAAVVHRLRRLA